MQTHELPMILFTVLSQMSVGAFLALGVVQTLAVSRYSSKTIDRLADPALLAIGPTLVAGFLASMLHMNDVTNTINVLRHWNSSYLSREIIVGMAFAGLGFVFTVMQWRRMGSAGLRRALALVTAAVGVLLVWVQSMVYYSLVTVPAWNTWATPLRFFATTVLLGSLAVGVAFAWNIVRAERTARRNDEAAPAEQDGPAGQDGAQVPGSRPSRGGGLAMLVRPVALTTSERESATELTRTSLRVVSAVATTVALVVVVSLPLYLAGLAQEGSRAALASGETFDGAFFIVRLGLLVVGAVVLSLVTFRLAADRRSASSRLTLLVSVALLVCFVSEIMGRSIFYESMIRIGM